MCGQEGSPKRLSGILREVEAVATKPILTSKGCRRRTFLRSNAPEEVPPQLVGFLVSLESFVEGGELQTVALRVAFEQSSGRSP